MTVCTIPTPSITITHGTETHIEMDRQSRACCRASQAKPVSDPQQQSPNRNYATKDNTIPWMPTHADELPIPRAQRTSRSECEWDKRMRSLKEIGQQAKR